MAISKKSLILFVLIVIEVLLITYCRNIFGSLVSPVMLLLVSISIGVITMVYFKKEEDIPSASFWKTDRQTYYFMLLFAGMAVLTLFLPKRGYIGIVENFLINPQYSDVMPTIQVMTKRFVSGEPVYQYIENFGYKIAPSYLPMVWFPFVPAELLHIDYRYATWLFWLVTILLLMITSIRRSNGTAINLIGTLLLGLYILSVIDKEPAALAWTPELANASFYVLLLMGLLSNNTVVKAAAITGCLMSRYSIVLFIPLVFLIEWNQNGIKKSLILFGYTFLFSALLMLPLIGNHWKELYDGYKYYAVSGIGEWKHLAANGLPLHIFNGNGLAAWVYTFKSGSIEDKFNFMHQVHLTVVVLTVLVLSGLYWFNRGMLHPRWYVIGAIKIYLAVFYGFIQVPYTYLFLVPVLYSIALFMMLHKYSGATVAARNEQEMNDKPLLSEKTKAILLELLPYIIILWYLGMAVYYYKARISYGDTGYYLYKIIQTGGFNIESGRAISIISQWFPILLIKIGAPLRIVMIGYSVNLALVYVACFLVIRYFLKSHFLAWGALLCTHLFLHYGYFYPTEMIFSSAIMVLIGAFLTYNDRNMAQPMGVKWVYGIGSILVLGIVLIHPFYYMVLCVILCCLYLIKGNKTYLYFIAFSIVLFLLKVTFFKSGYEAGKLSGIDMNVLTWDALSKSYLTSFWWNSFAVHFATARFLFYAWIVFLLWRKEWALALALPAGYLILYLMVYISIPNGESLGYMECYVAAISVFPLIVFLVYAEKNLTTYKNLFTILAFIISLSGLYRIKSEPIYKERVKYLESIFAYGREHHISKFLIEENEVKHEKILVGWALPYETLLLSTVSGQTQTIFINKAQYNLEAINNPRLFLGVPWENPIYHIKLNSAYFRLDTLPYVRINGLNF